MRLIILTQYFPPEVGAPQNRLYETAVRLKQKGINIEVLTAMPNYPEMEIHAGYKGKWYMKEDMDGVTVHRSWIWVSKKRNIFSRLMNYFSFVFSSLWIGCFKLGKADFLLCESPPLFLGLSALALRKAKHAKLIFNVSDLWPETAEKLGLIKNRLLLSVTKKLEEHIYSKSTLITGQTQGIVKNIQERFPAKILYWLPNGVDMNFYKEDKASAGWRKKNGFLENDFLILYAGIIGHAQGLEIVLKAAQKTNGYPVKWILLGSGPEKEKLLAVKAEMKSANVFFFDTLPKSAMPEVWKSVDVSLVPLRRLDIFKGAIPSKLFESLAMKKPLLLGVEGEAKELFIDEGKAGLAFIPDDGCDLANKAMFLYNNRKDAITMGTNGHNYVNAKFNRDIIADNFHKILFDLNSETGG
ncbi:MAG: glycosyltransferase family 4 protein [Bacteroidia bacterium]